MNDTSVHLFDDYFLDLARGCLTHRRVPVHLRRQSYQVLKYLVENRGCLISKDQLIEEVWEGRAVTDGSLGKCIEELREALGEKARNYVRTERGRGYIFDVEKPRAVLSEQVDIVKLLVEDDYNPVTSVSSLQLTKARTRPTVLGVSVLAVAIVASVFVYIKYFSPREININSIAVLPFVNATADPNAQYVSDGLTENLIDELARVPGLKVIARSSSFNYRGQDVDVRAVGRTLGVRALVTGRLEQRGDNLVVTAELVDAENRSRLWGEQYTRKTSDIQHIQQEIAGAIAEKLQLRVSAVQQQKLTSQATVNPQAYEFYLNGLFHFNQGNKEGIRKGLDYFNQAVLLDPNFAPGWACVSRANSLLGGNSLSNPKDTHVRAKAAAQRALELDETLGDAHLALGRLKQNEWDWSGAEQEYKRAIELSPSLASAHAEYAQFLATMLRHGEASREIKRAQELDPMSIRFRRREAWLLYLARRMDEAIAVLEATRKDSPPTAGSRLALGFMYEAAGSPEQAVREFREAINIDGEDTGKLCYLAGGLAVAARKKEALQIIERLNRSKDYVSPTELASVYARLKDTEAAIALLEKAYAEHDPQLQILNLDPFLDNIRSDPRFQDLLRRVGLPSRAQA